MSMNKT